MKAFLIQTISLFAASFFTAATIANNEMAPQHFPATATMKQALVQFGFEDNWRETQGGEKMSLPNGELWLREGDYFAVMTVSDANEESMQISLVNNLSVCTKIAMAVTGDSSADTFSTYSQLTKQALLQPETKIHQGGTATNIMFWSLK